VEAGGVEISVIVLAFRMVERLDACLTSLEADLEGIAHEIIVVANGAPGGIEEVLRRHPGAVVVRPAVNLGYAGGANVGAEWASGAVLAFVNDDAVVVPGWSRALLERLAREPSAAVVSSVITDGEVVLEAGGEFVQGIQPASLGRGRSIPSIGEAHEVAWTTACSMSVRREAFVQVGGFDERYHPAYFEDVDLCLRLRARGWSIWVEPASIAVHAESASTNPFERSVIFERTRHSFLDVWNRHQPLGLGSFPRATDDRRLDQPREVPARRASAVILVVDDRVPDATLGSGLPRMLQHLQALRSLGHEVVFVPLDGNLDPTPVLEELSISVLDPVVAASASIDPDVVIVSRPHNLERANRIVEQHLGVPLIYDAEARFALRIERQAALTSDPRARARLAFDAARMAAIEADLCQRADAITCIGADEAAWFTDQGAPIVRVITPLPDRIDRGHRTRFEDRTGAVAICGWLPGADSPNGDGLRWFAQEVLPLIVEDVPGVELRVTGADPPAALIELESAHLRFVGAVEDLGAFLNDARVSIVPLRYGAGVKIKVIDAIAALLPTVTTSVGAEGIDAPWRATLQVADTPQDFATKVVELMVDPESWRRVHEAMRVIPEDCVVPAAQSWNELLITFGISGSQGEVRTAEAQATGIDASLSEASSATTIVAQGSEGIHDASDAASGKVVSPKQELASRAAVAQPLLREQRAYRRELESLSSLLDAHRVRVRELEEQLYDVQQREASTHGRVGFRAMDRISVWARANAALFWLGRRIAKLIAGPER
jgi:O-antigen biosynthesis protein